MKILNSILPNYKKDSSNRKKVVYFAHGLESSPKSLKITHLRNIAEDKGFHCIVPDYSNIPVPEKRVEHLLDLEPKAEECLVLVGSSIGSYISTIASKQINPAGLFLIAPAFYLEKLQDQDPSPHALNTMVIHGWNDEIVPFQNAIKFAEKWKTKLLMLQGDHGLIQKLGEIGNIFSDFLDETLALSSHAQSRGK